MPLWLIRNTLGQGVNFHVPRPTEPFTLPGSMNWYQFQFRVITSYMCGYKYGLLLGQLHAEVPGGCDRENLW